LAASKEAVLLRVRGTSEMKLLKVFVCLLILLATVAGARADILYSDNFNRANSQTLGGSWEGNNTATLNVSIYNNQLRLFDNTVAAGVQLLLRMSNFSAGSSVVFRIYTPKVDYFGAAIQNSRLRSGDLGWTDAHAITSPAFSATGNTDLDSPQGGVNTVLANYVAGWYTINYTAFSYAGNTYSQTINTTTVTALPSFATDPSSPWFQVFTSNAFTGTEFFIDDFCHFNGTTSYADCFPPTPTPYFSITAFDLYNSSAITTFNATINGSFYSTTNGTINTNINQSQGFIYNINVSASNYFGRTYENYNTSSSLSAQLWQYQLNVTVVDAVTSSVLTGWNFTLPLFSQIGNSSVPLPVRVSAGSYTANLSLAGYGSTSYSFTATALGSAAVTIFMSPYVNFTLLKESNGAAFNVSTTQQTLLTVVCANTSITYTFNASTASVPINCTWTFMKMDVIYNSSSYFRTLVPASTDRTITWYLLDLTVDQAVQIILQLNDLTGQFLDGYATLKKVILGAERDITVQYWDVENQVTGYFITNGLYTLSITAPDGTVRSIGYLIADAAGTKTITVPEIAFVPEQGVGGTINWDWNDEGLPLIRLQYNDTTSSGTSNLMFSVYNGSNVASQLYTTTQINVNYVSLSYGISNTSSYLACFNATHPTYGFISQCQIYTGLSLDIWDTSDFGDDAWKITGWISIIFLVVIYLAIAPFDDVIAMAMTTIFMWILMNWNWLSFGSELIDYTVLSLFAAITIFTYYWKGGAR